MDEETDDAKFRNSLFITDLVLLQLSQVFTGRSAWVASLLQILHALDVLMMFISRATASQGRC